jgi:hypothetical protein
MKLVQTALGKLREKSTWVGFAALGASVGLKLDEAQWGSVAALVIALIGVYEVFRKEGK